MTTSGLGDHLAPLSGDWAVWRWSALRGAGFPVRLVLRLAAVDAAARADELLAADDAHAAAREVLLERLRPGAPVSEEVQRAMRRARRHVASGKLPSDADVQGIAEQEVRALVAARDHAAAARDAFTPAFDAAVVGTSRALRAVAADDRFREAVSWQNRAAVHTGLDALARTPQNEPPNAVTKRYEDLVAIYLHRYATKNDTIGFFGPWGWARWEPIDERLVAQPGPALLSRRRVYFEQWPIDALAQRLTNDARLRAWAAPRRYAFVRTEGALAISPLTGKTELTDVEQIVLATVDGVAPARAIAEQLTREHPALFATEAIVLDTLGALVEKQLVAWTFELRPIWEPDRELRRRLERIGDPPLRDEALAQLAELERGRDEVAAAAGDAQRLGAALTSLESTFVGLTGAAPTRLGGSTYAGRGLVFEDTRRDFALTLGPRILEEIGPALALVLTSARWLTFETARAYTAAFREAYVAAAKRAGSPRVPFADFWLRTQRLVHGEKGRPLDAVARTFRERWTEILQPLDGRRVNHDSAALASRVAEAFDAPHPGWAAARHHAPDLMIAARGIDAFRRGDYLAVLGEVHVALNTLDVATAAGQHPKIEDLTLAFDRDIPESRVILVPPKHSPWSSTVRLQRAVVRAQDFDFESGFEGSLRAPDRVLRSGDLTLLESDAGELVVAHAGGEIPLLEMMGQTLSEAIANVLSFLPESDHAPRVTVDRLVLRRESWSVMPSTLAFAFARSDADAFVLARRWARDNDLPRFLFVRSPLEVKPMYVDVASPVSLRILSRLVRNARDHARGEAALSVTEMLPGLEEAWLEDISGESYTSEIRVVAVDGRRA